jgi:hypothetical protein
MKAISVKQPWAFLIVNGNKDIENRSWPTKYRGHVFIHASKEIDQSAKQLYRDLIPASVYSKENLGGIVGGVTIADCVEKHESKWFQGPHGFVLADAYPLPFRALRGRLGIFNCDPYICTEKPENQIVS